MGRAETGGLVGKMMLSSDGRMWRFEKGKNSLCVAWYWATWTAAQSQDLPL